MTDLKQLVRTIQSLPPDKAETVLRNHMQQEWRNGYDVGVCIKDLPITDLVVQSVRIGWNNARAYSISEMQSDAAARGANNLPSDFNKTD